MEGIWEDSDYITNGHWLFKAREMSRLELRVLRSMPGPINEATKPDKIHTMGNALDTAVLLETAPQGVALSSKYALLVADMELVALWAGPLPGSGSLPLLLIRRGDKIVGVIMPKQVTEGEDG